MLKELAIFLSFLPLVNMGIMDKFKDFVSSTCGSVLCPDVGDWKDLVYTECCKWNNEIQCCIFPQKWVIVLCIGVLLLCCCGSICCARR